MNGLPGRVSRLEEQQLQLAQEHQKIYDRMAADEKHFEVVTIELKTMVSQVITDLTFIRTELFK
jgi:thymidylate kinase